MQLFFTIVKTGLILFAWPGCDLTVHKQCVEEMVEVCGGKKRGAGKRASAFIPVLNPRKPGSIANQLTGMYLFFN